MPNDSAQFSPCSKGGKMKSRRSLTPILAAVLALIAIGLTTNPKSLSAQGKKQELFWYLVFLEPITGSPPQYVGSSPLGEEDFAKQCAGANFVRLDNLIYRDNNGVYKSYKDRDPIMEPRIYINPKSIRAFQRFGQNPVGAKHP